MLFDRENKGSSELEKLTGMWYASTPFSVIKPEIMFATREVGRLVGEKVIKRAEAEYNSGGSELADAVRMPVACLAIQRHSALSLVSHEANGRKMKVDEHEKVPFEWMIDRDDRAMRERYYRALDAMYQYLIENDISEFSNSAALRDYHNSIFENIDDFEKYYPLESSYYVFFMMQGIIQLEMSRARYYFGGNLTSNEPGIVEQIKTYIALKSIATAAHRWSIDIFPLEIARRFSPTYQGNNAKEKATIEEIAAAIENLKSQADTIRDEVIKSMRSVQESLNMPENDKRNKYFTTV